MGMGGILWAAFFVVIPVSLAALTAALIVLVNLAPNSLFSRAESWELTRFFLKAILVFLTPWAIFSLIGYAWKTLENIFQ